MRIMTFNIRTGLADDGPNSWPLRSALAVQTIRDHDPDVVGIQEPTREQWTDLARGLGDNWDGIEHGLENKSGSLQGLFYRKSRLFPAGDGCFWLSDTPHVPGSITFPNQWGARAAVWARFLDATAGREFIFMVTHMDTHPGSWMPSARVLANEIALEFAGLPVVLVGDFNCAAGDEPWRHLTGPGGLKDSWRELGKPDDGLTTFNAFRRESVLPLDRPEEMRSWLDTVAEPERVDEYLNYLLRHRNYRIDWILYRGPLSPRDAFADFRSPDGRLPSDHYPVIADLDWA